MLKKVLTWFESLQAARKFASGTIAVYIFAWLAKGAVTLLWEKILEREAPAVFKQIGAFLATELVIGMIIMLSAILFVPAVFAVLMKMSNYAYAAAIRFTKRVGKDEYIANLAADTIATVKLARDVIDFRHEPLELAYRRFGVSHEETEKLRQQGDQIRDAKFQRFRDMELGKLKFYVDELEKFSYVSFMPHERQMMDLQLGRNTHSLADLANAAEKGAYRALADIGRSGYA